jgi:hypothetical protein
MRTRLNRTPRPTLNRVSTAALMALGLLASGSASAASCTWNSTNGNWNELAKWLSCVTGNGNPGGVPGSADNAAIGAAGVVTVNNGQSIGALSNAGILTLDGGSLRVTGGITGSGTTTVQNGGLLNLENTQTVGGNATIVFGSGGNNRIGIDGGSKVVTFAAGTTIRGQSGSIGLGQLVNGSGNSIINQGLISSDSGGTISIVQSGMTNQGVAEAKGAGSVLSLQAGVNNIGGTLRATGGGVVRQEGVAVTGGTISTSGGGSYQVSGSGSNFLSGVTLTGGSVIDMASATSTARVTSGMTLNGTINVNNSSLLNFEGDQTLSGSGSIVLGGAGNNRIGVDGGSKTLTVASGMTIRGENGSIGLGQLVNGSGNALVNNGTISADVAGGVITLLGLSSGITNNGTISALNGGTLQLQSNLTGGVGSQLVAGAGSVISQQGVTITGIVNTSGSGSLRASGSGSNYLSGVTLTGTLDLASATATERVVGNLVLNGTVNINNSSLLNFEGDQTLSGSGSIVLGGAGNNRIGVDGGSKTLTVASGMTIRGENGLIGLGQLVNGSGNALVNNGTISADVAGGVITLLGLSSGITNNGTISALNGGTLQLQSNLTGTPTGQLVAGAGSTILQQGVTITGVINTSGSGNLQASGSGSNYLSGVTLNGNLDLASATAAERVVGNLTLNGTINVNNSSILNFEGDQTISGNGSIVLGGTGGSNRIGVDGGSKTLTVASGITIRGENGTIGVGQLVNGSGNSLVNQGLIRSDGGGTIRMAGATFVNQSFAEAVGAGSVLQLDSTVVNGGGTLRSFNGGVVLQNGVTVNGGTISNSSGGTYRVAGTSFLDGVTLTSGSNIDMSTAAATGRVTNGITLNGTLNLGSSSLLNMEGDQTLSGSGSIVFAAGGNNRVGVDGGSKTLTIASGMTIRGADGSIGLGQLVNGSGNRVVNNGTINSDGGGVITIQGLDGGMANHGLLRAQNGTLNVSTALSGAGTLQVDATGTMNLAAGAKAQGTLAMGAAGAALNLNTGNLTIGSDYTNAAAGSGNGFNRRAGVSGAGQIVAGGDVAQVITGAGVTGGSTSNATLTIGNVRVGANTYNVNIGNSGTNGPALRGALQTSVNGGNITDSRLGGSGVTAGNYNAGGPGGAGSNQVITFTAGSAGALAPLAGQAINLRSTYENIADQKLNIVLAGGAAAYNAAVGSTTPAPVVVANQRVGGSNAVGLTISNSAAAGSFSEDLRASGGGSTGAALLSGAGVSGLLAGNSQAGALTARVDTSTAGAKSGTVTINYQTAGAVNGVSNGLGTASAGSQTVNVSGNVYQAAAGQLLSAPLNFGTVQVGQVVTQSLVVRNTAIGAAGFVEDLHASFGGSSGTGAGLISGSGSLSGIAAGSNSTAGNGSMVVSVNTAAAGTVNGSIAVNYTTAGAVNGVSNGLGTASVGSEAYGVQGQINATANVINQASPLVNTATVNLGAVRVGAAAPSGTVSVTNVATATPQAALNASMGATTGPATASGSFNLLNPGATNNSSLVVGLNTATAGNFTGANAGTAIIQFVSDASNVGGCGANCQLNLASQVVNVEGKVYTQAVGTASGTAINFGVVRVGDTVSARNITVNNTAAATALNDTLQANLSGVGGAFSGNGSTGPISAQAAGLFSVGLDTSTAGVFSSNGTVAFASHNADMADVSAGANAAVTLAAQVNNLANGDFDLLGGSGTLSQTGTTYVLDLGNVVLGDSVGAQLQLDNDVTGPADALSGSFDLNSADDFSYNGWNPLAFLAAGQAGGLMNINWLAGALGQFSDTITFFGLGTNASDTAGLAQQRQLIIRANVISGGTGTGIPEPGTLALLLGAAAAGWAARVGRKAVLQ